MRRFGKASADAIKGQKTVSRLAKCASRLASVFIKITPQKLLARLSKISSRTAVIVGVLSLFSLAAVAAVIVLFASHVFGRIDLNVGNIDFETQVEFGMSTADETLAFTYGGEQKEYVISLRNDTESHLEFEIYLDHAAEADVASAILVYFDGEFIGTLGAVCSAGDGGIRQALIGGGYVRAGFEDSSHTLTFELHEAAPDSYFDGRGVGVSISACSLTIDRSEYMFATDENEFLRAVDDVNTGLVEANKIVLGNDILLTSDYRFDYPTEIDLNGFSLDAGGCELSFGGSGVSVIDSSAPVAAFVPTGSIAVDSSDGILDIRDFPNRDGGNGGAAYGGILNPISYDTALAETLIAERLDSRFGNGVAGGSQVSFFGALKGYVTTADFEFGDYDTASGILTLPALPATEVCLVSADSLSFELKVIGDDALAFDEIVNGYLSHIPTDGESKITSDLFLPKSIKGKNATVTWTSGDLDTISDDGKISNVVNDNQQVALYAEIRINDRVYTKEFLFRVSSQNNETKFSYLVAQLSPITLTSVYDPEKNNGNYAFHHLPIVDPEYPRATDADVGYDYRETFMTPSATQSYTWIEYKDIGLERLEYRVTNTYNYVTVESGTSAQGLPITYAYLNIPVFYTYAQIELTGYYSDTEYYTDIVNVIIQLGDDADLQNKVFRYVENILNNTDILQNILDTRAAEGMANECGDFTLPNEYITYDIIYKAADSSKDAITDVTTLYRGEGSEQTVSGYSISVDPANFYTTETPLGITVTIKHKTATDSTPATRILYVDAPPVIKPDSGGFANLSVFNSVKYQIYTQLPEDERDGESGFVISGNQITNNTGAYILMRDAEHVNVKNLTLTTTPSLDSVNEKVYVLSRLIEWATSKEEYSASEVWGSAGNVYSDGKDYLTDEELDVILAYWSAVTGSEMSDEIRESVFETAVGRVIVDGKAIGDAVKACGFSNSYYFKYTETLYWAQDKQNFGTPAGGQWDGSPPNLGEFTISYTFNAAGALTGYSNVSGGNWQRSKYYTNSYYQEDSSPYISEAEAEVLKALILNMCDTRTTNSSNPGVNFVNVFNANTIIPNYLRDGGAGDLVREMYEALSAYPTRLDGERVTLNKFTSTLIDGTPVVTSLDNSLVGLQYFVNLESLSIIGDTENSYGLSAFLDSSALLNFFNQTTTYNTKLSLLELIACARNYVEFDIEFTERLTELSHLNYAQNSGIKNVGPLVNLNMEQLAYLNICGVGVDFEFSEYVMENIYYKYDLANGTPPTIYYYRDGSTTVTRYMGEGTPAESLTYLNEIGKIKSEYLQLCHGVVTDLGTDEVIWRIESGNTMSYVTVAGDLIGFDNVENYYYCTQSVGGLTAGHIYAFNRDGDNYFTDLGFFEPVSELPDSVEFTEDEKAGATGSSGEENIVVNSESLTYDTGDTSSEQGSVTNQTSIANGGGWWGDGTYGTLTITYSGGEIEIEDVSSIGCDRSIRATSTRVETISVEDLRSAKKYLTYYYETDGTLVRCEYTYKSGTAKEQTYEVTETYYKNDYFYIQSNNNRTKTYLSSTEYSDWTELSFLYYYRSGWSTRSDTVEVSPSQGSSTTNSTFDENNYVTVDYPGTVTRTDVAVIVSPIGIIESAEKVEFLRTMMARAVAGSAIYKYLGNTRTVDYYNNSTALYKSFTFTRNYYYNGTVDASGFITWTRNTAIGNNASVGEGGMDDILAAANASIGNSDFLMYYGMYYGYAGTTITAASGYTYENRGIYRLLINDAGQFYFEHDAEKMGLKVNSFEILTSVVDGILAMANTAEEEDEGKIYYYSGGNDNYYQGRRFYVLSVGDTGEYVCQTFGAIDDHTATTGSLNLSNERLYEGNFYGGTGGSHNIIVSATVIVDGREYVRKFLVEVIG